LWFVCRYSSNYSLSTGEAFKGKRFHVTLRIVSPTTLFIWIDFRLDIH